MRSELVGAVVLSIRDPTSVHPAGGVTVAVLGRTIMDAIMTSPVIVPVGLAMRLPNKSWLKSSHGEYPAAPPAVAASPPPAAILALSPLLLYPTHPASTTIRSPAWAGTELSAVAVPPAGPLPPTTVGNSFPEADASSEVLSN